jgi:hypothetical protein
MIFASYIHRRMPPGEEGTHNDVGTNRKGISPMESEEGVPPIDPK